MRNVPCQTARAAMGTLPGCGLEVETVSMARSGIARYTVCLFRQSSADGRTQCVDAVGVASPRLPSPPCAEQMINVVNPVRCRQDALHMCCLPQRSHRLRHSSLHQEASVRPVAVDVPFERWFGRFPLPCIHREDDAQRDEHRSVRPHSRTRTRTRTRNSRTGSPGSAARRACRACCIALLVTKSAPQGAAHFRWPRPASWLLAAPHPARVNST
ncbi:uncharacterized protein C8Q71DRAFT_267843 [Rhodofomes roseus]|uniref:Uncharacterized protein n=1 Tax=Rhodofomes roseus TaxID=34475 RepID=A0ABQ8K6S3_9APHY|nr:uncharacterized protein C8Q71DRAFT_267843 [Rhodofomes roseus]KAH9832233.1 hypothetical protein C8Q71DRAFT_267843 [Rhodofomes roseus]